MNNLIKQKGFALLYAILLSGVVLTIGVILMNIITKELIYSSIGRNSEVSYYYVASSGRECLFYYDSKDKFAKVSISEGVRTYSYRSGNVDISCFGGSITMNNLGNGTFSYSGNLNIDGQERLMKLTINKNIECLNGGNCSGDDLVDRYGTVITSEGYSGASGVPRLTKRVAVYVY